MVLGHDKRAPSCSLASLIEIVNIDREREPASLNEVGQCQLAQNEKITPESTMEQTRVAQNKRRCAQTVWKVYTDSESNNDSYDFNDNNNQAQ